MIIKAVKFVEKGFYAQGFAFGGEEGPQNYDDKIRYRGSLQNYVIDTGEDVILVDTGLPKETPDAAWDGKASTYLGRKIEDYVSALKTAGYEVVSGPRTTGDGYYESCIVAVEGNQIEITE